MSNTLLFENLFKKCCSIYVFLPFILLIGKSEKKSRHFPISLSRVSICVRDVAYLWRWRGAKCYQAQAVPGSESQSASGSGQRGRAGAGASDILSSSSDLIRAVELTSHLESFSTVFIPNVSSFFCFCPQDYM